MNKKDLSERDICSKFIGPAVKRAGWDWMMQIREEVNFTKGRIIVRGKLVRGTEQNNLGIRSDNRSLVLSTAGLPRACQRTALANWPSFRIDAPFPGSIP